MPRRPGLHGELALSRRTGLRCGDLPSSGRGPEVCGWPLRLATASRAPLPAALFLLPCNGILGEARPLENDKSADQGLFAASSRAGWRPWDIVAGDPAGNFSGRDDDASHHFDSCPDRRRESGHGGSREAGPFPVKERGSDSPISRLRARGGGRRYPGRSRNGIRSRASSDWRVRRPGRIRPGQIRPTRGGRSPAGPPISISSRPTCADFRRSLLNWTHPPEDRNGFSPGRKRRRAA